MLKLIVNNRQPVAECSLSQKCETKLSAPESFPHLSFLVDFQEFSQNLYVLRAKEMDHGLTFEMTLELKESYPFSDNANEESYLVPVITCNFPHIDDEKLHHKVFGDEYLTRMLILKFQLKVLEQLFLFCEDKNVVKLIITFNEMNLGYIEAYRRFFFSEEQIITPKGEQTEIVIFTHVEIYDEIIDFIDETDNNFRQTLWQEQRFNPAFQQYLKRYSCTSF